MWLILGFEIFPSFVLIFSSVEPTYSTVAWLALHLFVFAAIFMIQFAYYVPENLHVQESKIVLIVCMVASSIVYPYHVYKILSIYFILTIPPNPPHS